MALGVSLVGNLEPAAAAENAMLDRPVFDRAQGTVLIPYKGPVPRVSIERTQSGTRLQAVFSGSVTKLPTAYKLGLFHPLVSKVEMENLGAAKVRVTIQATQPSRLALVPDPARGVLRLVVSEDTVPVAAAPAAPARPAPPQARPAERPGLDRLGAQPPAAAPQPLPSLPPTQRPREAAGTPTSGEYVYRKAIPGRRGDDVTEVAVRTSKQAAIQVHNDPRSEAVVVNVVRPDQAPPTMAEPYARPPLPNEPWWLPDRRHEAAYRPVAAVDSLLGYTLMGERAPNFGSDLSGQGAALWGFAGHVPLSSALNLSLGAESFGYTVSSVQIPDARTQRNEYFLYTRGEYLALRRPWVLAVGPGYWVRYVQTTTQDVLAPPEPSMLFVPTLVQHGPVVAGRIFYPFADSWAFAAEAGMAPFMMGGNDLVSPALGNLFGAQGMAGIKWSTRHVSLSAGYRHMLMANYTGSYMFNRGGPEVSFV